jgi:hypothetical protein
MTCTNYLDARCRPDRIPFCRPILIWIFFLFIRLTLAHHQRRFILRQRRLVHALLGRTPVLSSHDYAAKGGESRFQMSDAQSHVPLG